MAMIKLLLFTLVFLGVMGIVSFIIQVENCNYPHLFDQSTNIALEKNGAAVIYYSTEYVPGWEVRNLIDGTNRNGWGTNSKTAKGEWVEIILPGTKPTTIKQIRINPGPTVGDVPWWGLKYFHIEISTDEAKYKTILKGSFDRAELNKTKTFNIPPVLARFVRINIDSNQDPLLSQYGGVAEMEVYSCSLKTFIGKQYPKIVSPIVNLSEKVSQFYKSITGQDAARQKLPVTAIPEIDKYFRLPQETIVRANDALRYPPYPKHLTAGTVVKIIKGPYYSDGYEWWKLSEEEWGGYVGWFALKESSPR